MPRKKPKARDTERQVDDKLDEALKDTFPASDPVAFIQPAPKQPHDAPREKDRRKSG